MFNLRFVILSSDIPPTSSKKPQVETRELPYGKQPPLVAKWRIIQTTQTGRNWHSTLICKHNTMNNE